jgi:hypothetical protein
MVNRIMRANRDLPTPDKVLLFVTVLVGFLAITLVIGMFVAAIFGPPGIDITPIVELISNAFLMLTGAIVGYIGGQGVAKAYPPPPKDLEEGPDA